MELSKMTCHFVKCEDDTPMSTTITSTQITQCASRHIQHTPLQ